MRSSRAIAAVLIWGSIIALFALPLRIYAPLKPAKNPDLDHRVAAQHDRQSDDATQRTPVPSAAPKQSPAKQNPADGNADEPGNKAQVHDPWAEPIVRVTIWILGVYILLFVVGAFQTYFVIRTATAATKSAELAERALHLSERAVVLVESVSADELVALVPTTTFTLRLRNYGRTTAPVVFFSIESVATPITAGGDAAIAIGAGGVHEYDFRPLFNMDHGTIEGIKNGLESLSMQIEITYRDLFDLTHHTVAHAYYQWVLRKLVLHHSRCD